MSKPAPGPTAPKRGPLKCVLCGSFMKRPKPSEPLRVRCKRCGSEWEC